MQARHLPDDSVHDMEVTPSRGGAISAHREKSGPLLVRAHQTIPNNAATATVRFGFTAGQWETVLTLSPGGSGGASRLSSAGRSNSIG